MTDSAVNDTGPQHVTADRYERLELIGTGSFGDVYRGWDREAGFEVALKVIDLENVEDDIQDIHKEVATLSQCRSENITEYYASVLGLGTTELLIVMELMACSVGDLLSDEGSPLDERSIAFVLRETLKALAYLHDSHRIHRDVKSANVLLSAHGEVKISDFGVSGKLSKTVAFKRRTFVGSPFWMAPEVIKANAGGDGYSETADIWSLGVTAYEMAMGRPPHADLHPMRALFLIPNEEAPRLEGPFSPEFKSFIALCLQKEAARRPSAGALLRHPFLAGPHDSGRLAELVQIHSEKKRKGQNAGVVKPTELTSRVANWDFDSHQAHKPPSRATIKSHQINSFTIRDSTWGATFAARQLQSAISTPFPQIPEAPGPGSSECHSSSGSSVEGDQAWGTTHRATYLPDKPADYASLLEDAPQQTSPERPKLVATSTNDRQLPNPSAYPHPAAADGQLAFRKAAQNEAVSRLLLHPRMGTAHQNPMAPNIHAASEPAGGLHAETFEDKPLESLPSLGASEISLLSPLDMTSGTRWSSNGNDLHTEGPLAHFLMSRWQYSMEEISQRD